MALLSLLLHYSILFYIWTFDLRLNLNDGKVTWMSYLSNMQGKGIFDGLFFPPGLKRDVSHGCAPFQARKKKAKSTCLAALSFHTEAIRFVWRSSSPTTRLLSPLQRTNCLKRGTSMTDVSFQPGRDK